MKIFSKSQCRTWFFWENFESTKSSWMKRQSWSCGPISRHRLVFSSLLFMVRHLRKLVCSFWLKVWVSSRRKFKFTPHASWTPDSSQIPRLPGSWNEIYFNRAYLLNFQNILCSINVFYQQLFYMLNRLKGKHV